MVDVFEYGLVWSWWNVFWYSGMTPIIDWYLYLLLEHETGRATRPFGLRLQGRESLKVHTSK